MPMIDMSMEKLLKYKGQSPRPKDFDKYWSKALAELDKVDPDVELVPIKHPARNAEAFHLYFTGVGGARIHSVYVRPKNIKGRIPAIVQFHGYSGNAGQVSPLMSWTAMGMAIASMDCRGQGGTSEDVSAVTGSTFHGHIIRGIESPEKLLMKSVFLDTAQLARIVMDFDEIDARKVASNGGSQGGALSVVCASLEPRISCCVSCFPFLSDYKRVWDMDCSGAYSEIRDWWFRKYDPLHEREDEFFNTLGYIDIQNLSPRIKGSVLMSVGLRDQVCPPSTVYAAFNKIKAKKKIMVYPDFGHEDLNGWNDAAAYFICENLLK
ncbi:MAG TPA: acetylesterase [Lentisphaeria bacterium]|nr:MAG: acetylesterase [Lentisphaerae bacterium GWF2_50_93]HCE46463.1 acetylesterase [Lentisphaeria bacterium]